MILAFGLAFAAGTHAGIPVRGVPGLGEPTFLTPRTGWTSSVEGGFVRVYVGPTEADAAEWMLRAREGLTLQPSPATVLLGDEAFGDGDALYVFRDGNVAVFVRVERGALATARTLHAAIEDGPAWPAAPRLLPRGEGGWELGERGVSVSFTGGQLVPFRPGTWSELPATVVVWDAWGRPAEWERP